ncbi:hypothetical protein G7Y89_g5682 [Cudoniella acicularis]|uniref:Uncharacterized protein n=1 Tax=Cudoniella acicularis TaxID=354080 RepID=A0A8H4RPB1_9HELO|nr:hypothetical protein G7Y89_g5682 [Cudoniella acicularis]
MISQNGNSSESPKISSTETKDDDDVQFIFSAPRRRKRRRKRVDSLENKPQEKPKTSIPPLAHPTPDSAPPDPQQRARRGATGMVQQLELCHLSSNEKMSIPARSESLPAPLNAPVQASQHQPLRVDPSVESRSLVYPGRSLPGQISTSYSEGDPSPQVEPEKVSQDWRPINFGSISAKRQKRNGENLGTNPYLDDCDRFSEVSPKTAPCSMPAPLRDLAWGYIDIGSTKTRATPGLTGPEVATGSFYACDTLADVEPGAAVPHVPRAISPGASNAYITWQIPPMLPFEKSPGSNLTLPYQSSNYVLHGHVDFPPNRNQEPTNCGLCQTSTSNVMSNLSQFHPKPVVPLSPPRHLSAIGIAPCIPRVKYACVPPPSRSEPRSPLVLHQSPAEFPLNLPQTQSSDFLRRPSLYGIPAWPLPVPFVQGGFVSRIPSPRTELTCRTVNNRAFASEQTPHSSDTPPSLTSKTVARNRGGSDHRIVPQLGPSGDRPSKHSIESYIDAGPRKRARNQYSPNLIVDIAETCQYHFPFAAVAHCHNVPIEKVFDTFSGIIQLPLLRHADDRRRHGSLGKQRMKEYRDAKNAMEKAQEAEHKAHMKTLNASSERGIGKPPKSPAKAPVLLKAAVLNRTRESQSSTGS